MCVCGEALKNVEEEEFKLVFSFIFFIFLLFLNNNNRIIQLLFKDNFVTPYAWNNRIFCLFINFRCWWWGNIFASSKSLKRVLSLIVSYSKCLTFSVFFFSSRIHRFIYCTRLYRFLFFLSSLGFLHSRYHDGQAGSHAIN